MPIRAEFRFRAKTIVTSMSRDLYSPYPKNKYKRFKDGRCTYNNILLMLRSAIFFYVVLVFGCWIDNSIISSLFVNFYFYLPLKRLFPRRLLKSSLLPFPDSLVNFSPYWKSLRQRRFWATHANRKLTFAIPLQWFYPNWRAYRF